MFVFHADRWRIEQPVHTEGMFINPGKGITVKPLEIPLAGNKRAIAQCARSVFSNVENIENVLRWSEFAPTSNQIKPNPYLEYFDIAANEKKVALADLKSMNIHEMSMFPDLDTACRILAKEYFGE